MCVLCTHKTKQHYTVHVFVELTYSYTCTSWFEYCNFKIP